MARKPARKREMAVAVDLRSRRQAEGLSAEQLADLLDVADAKYVSALERGDAPITMVRAVRAALALKRVTVLVDGLPPVAVMPAEQSSPAASVDVGTEIERTARRLAYIARSLRKEVA